MLHVHRSVLAAAYQLWSDESFQIEQLLDPLPIGLILLVLSLCRNVFLPDRYACIGLDVQALLGFRLVAYITFRGQRLAPTAAIFALPTRYSAVRVLGKNHFQALGVDLVDGRDRLRFLRFP